MADLLVPHLSNIRCPVAGEKVYKDECAYSFDTPESETGLYICMNTFLGLGKNHVERHFQKTGNAVFLHLRRRRKQIKKSEDAPPQKKPTRLAIGVEGGFDTNEQSVFLEENTITILPTWTVIPLPNEDLPEMVQMCISGVLAAEDALKLEAAAAMAGTWDGETRVPTRHAENLFQLDNGKKIPPCGWKCEKCDLTANLWLNLTDGVILCGRSFFDGSGGNNHALEHYQQTKYPLTVKLGTITADGADIYSYDEDDMVADPNLSKHLAHFGINMAALEKTEKTMIELEIDLNQKVGEWDVIQEVGSQLKPLYGAGLTGMRNLGNSCYMNSVMQVIFTIPDFKKRYYDVIDEIFSSSPNDPTSDFNTQMSIFLQAFHIPSDFDDTFVNLGLGAFLMEWKEYFPEEQRLWQMQNPNIDSVFEALRKYTYRPFSGDRNVNSIDTRTYYYLRGFLEDAKKNGKDVALVPTWVQNIEEVRTMYYKGVNMPFQVNNVDITVSANAVYGITAGVLSGLLEKSLLDDLEIQQIYRNTSSMIAWGLVNDLSGRRDLALMYYPSLFEFYWFTARTYSLLHRKAISGGLPHKVLEETYKLYGNALKEHVTYVILNSSKEDEEGMLYFDDFIGNADLSIFNKTVNRAEDRIFTTSMAVNALLSTWSVLDKERGHHLRWDAETPTEVKNSIARAAKWLNKHVLDGHYKPWNAFFSGSVKGFSTIPFLYPSNRYEYLNGTKIPPGTKTVNGPTVLAMEGCISEEEYKKLMNKTHMGHYKTPTHFEGFNAENTVFPFWSSDTYTYSTSMLALAQFRILDQPLSPGI